MLKIAPALALLSLTGCAGSPGSLVLVFPSDQDKADAAHATVEAIKPMSPTDDECSRYLAFAEPNPGQIESSTEVDLANGVPTHGLKGFPTGYQTLLVKVTNGGNNLILHGCRTGSIDFGAKFEIDLVSTNTTQPDLSGLDFNTEDLQPPVDMAMHKFLQMTATEMRNSTRKLTGVVITLKDSATGTQTLTTDSLGVAKFDTVTMTPPFSITADAPVSNGYKGAVTLSGVSPTWTSSDTIVMQLPIELDPPATSATNTMSITVPDGTGQTFTAYYVGTNGLPGDILTATWSGNAAFAIQPLAAGSYRVGIIDAAPTNKAATTNALLSTGGSYTPQLTGGPLASDFKAYSASFSLGLVKSTNAVYTTQQYGMLLVLPSSQTVTAVPIFPHTSFAATGTVMPQPVPAMASSILGSAVLVSEQLAFSATARGELRHQYVGTTPAADSFGSAVPDPPTAMVSPSPVPAATSFTITATPPGSFPVSSSFVHVVIHDTAATPLYHWHMIAPAANPTTIVVPASVLPAGTYAVDVAFVEDFTLLDITVQATLTDDYSKLIRVVPQELSQSTINLTGN